MQLEFPSSRARVILCAKDPQLRNNHSSLEIMAELELDVDSEVDKQYKRYIDNLKMNLLPMVIMVGSLLASDNFASAAATNAIIQLAVFALTANIPAIVTGRMSYVDIAWPCGLVIIGLGPLIQGAVVIQG